MINKQCTHETDKTPWFVIKLLNTIAIVWNRNRTSAKPNTDNSNLIFFYKFFCSVDNPYAGAPYIWYGMSRSNLHADGTFRIDFVNGSHDDHVPLTDIIPLEVWILCCSLFLTALSIVLIPNRLINSPLFGLRCQHHLFLIDNGSHVRLPGSWSHIFAFTSFHDNLYLIDNESYIVWILTVVPASSSQM